MSGWKINNSSCHFLWVLCVTSVLCAGCAKREPAAGPAQILRLSQRNEPATLDPQLATLPDEYFPARALFEGLTTPAPDGGAPRSGVAERWESSPDGLTWTFHLRADAKWSNGNQVTAQDFIYSFRRILTPSLGAAKAPLFFAVRNARAYLRGEVTDFAAVGFAAPSDRTLVVTLEHPAIWLPALAATGAWLPVHRPTLAQHGEGRASRWSDPGHLVGNGPYTLAAWQRAQQIEFHKNPHYWNQGAVLIPTIRLVMFDNNDAEERAFRAGQIDVTMTVPATRLDHYMKNEPALIRRQPLYETRYLALNTRHGPLADARVRQALALALDRSALVTSVLKGGQQPTGELIPAGLGGLAPAAPLPVTTDPAEARRLLAEAGFPDGRGFPRLEFSTWTNTPVLEAIQQMWQQNLGITTAITLREGRAHLGALAAGEFDLALMPLIPDFDDPSDAFGDFLTDSPSNYGRWAHTGYDRQVNGAGRSLDAAARLDHYRVAEKILQEEMPAIPLYLSSQNYLVSPRVRGWQSDRLWTRYYLGITLQDN